MENVRLKNGQDVIIASSKEINEAIEENMGYEFAEAMQRFVGDQIYEYQQTAQAETYEKDAMESNLEDMTFLMHDVLDELDEVTNYMEEAKRINKDKIYQKLVQLRKMINTSL